MLGKLGCMFPSLPESCSGRSAQSTLPLAGALLLPGFCSGVLHVSDLRVS